MTAPFDFRSTLLTQQPHGVGLGLRWDFLEEVVAAPSRLELPFFEVTPENYMRRGGYFPNALAQVQQNYPLLSHGLMMNLGSTDPLDSTYLTELRGFLKGIGVPYHTDHLCWNGVNGQTLHDLLPLPLTRAALMQVVDNIRRAQDALGMPLGVENISYYTGLTAPAGLAEADFIAQVVDQAQCGLLLDLNNLQVNADNHGFAVEAMLQRLPLDRIVHLHVAGGERQAHLANLIIDTHGSSVDERVIGWMQWVVRRIGRCAVVYERDQNLPELAELLAEVASLQRYYDEALAEAPPLASPCHSLPELHPTTQVVTQVATLLNLTSEASLDHTTILAGLSRAIVGPANDPPFDPALHANVPFAQERWWIYRTLVRNSITSTLEDFLPRTKALAQSRWSDDIAAWLAQSGPRSKYLRDLPWEFASASYSQIDSASLLLHDLAGFECLQARVGAMADDVALVPADHLDLDEPLLLQPALALLTLHYAVQIANDHPATLPRHQPTYLMMYRDAAHCVRTLELSPAIAALTGELHAGKPLRLALFRAAQVEGAAIHGEIADEFLERMSGVLADFSERGILRQRIETSRPATSSTERFDLPS